MDILDLRSNQISLQHTLWETYERASNNLDALVYWKYIPQFS